MFPGLISRFKAIKSPEKIPGKDLYRIPAGDPGRLHKAYNKRKQAKQGHKNTQ